MINDDFDFTLDSSDFPVSIEEFAAYMDGNLTDDEMQRISSFIEYDDTMQGVMDSMEQSELTLAEYGQEDLQLPEEVYGESFPIPIIKEKVQDNIHNLDHLYKVAAFVPTKDDSEKKQIIQRIPPKVLDDDNQ